jgi:hypothetical protein
MHGVGYKGSKDIMDLEISLQVPCVHQEVHALEGVNDVCLVVIGIIREVAIRNLFRSANNCNLPQ